MKNFLKKWFGKGKDVEIPMAFKQTCVFAHSEQKGDKRIFKMQSGKIYLAELIEIDNTASHGADDTALRDLTWKVLDELSCRQDIDTMDYIFTGKTGEVCVLNHVMVANKEAAAFEIISDEWIKKYYPEQNKGFRFLR